MHRSGYSTVRLSPVRAAPAVAGKMVSHDGILVTVGMLRHSLPRAIDFAQVSMTRISIAGSMIGSIAETQGVLVFAPSTISPARSNLIPIDQINDAFDQMIANDVRFRFAIDDPMLHKPAE
jgi:alcohol dehydrogenase (NADP+)